MADYAEDVVDLLGELGVDARGDRRLFDGRLCGAGAAINRAPELFDGLVLADTRAGADSPEGRANRRSMLALVDREGPSGVAREMMPKLLGKTTQGAELRRGVDVSAGSSSSSRRWRSAARSSG